MDFFSDLDQINPEPLPDWTCMLPITVDTATLAKPQFSAEMPSSSSFQEPSTYTYLEPIVPTSSPTLPSYSHFPPTPESYTTSSVFIEDPVASDSESNLSQGYMSQQRASCHGAMLGNLCFMNGEALGRRSCSSSSGFGSPSPSVSSMSPVDMLLVTENGDATGQFAGERPSTSDSGCALDVFLPEPEPVSLQCAQCGTVSTSQWIKLESGHLLCLYCATSTKPETQPSSKRKKASVASENRECSNCSTTHTSLWRRNAEGNFNCNACGLYLKMNKVNRPITMRRDVIKRRQRKPKTASKKQKTASPRQDPPSFMPSPVLPEIQHHRAYNMANHDSESYSPQPVLPSINSGNYYSPVSPAVTSSPLPHSLTYEQMISIFGHPTHMTSGADDDVATKYSSS